jgi:hypothetical protein
MKLDTGFMGSFWEVWEGLRSRREGQGEVLVNFLVTFKGGLKSLGLFG